MYVTLWNNRSVTSYVVNVIANSHQVSGTSVLLLRFVIYITKSLRQLAIKHLLSSALVPTELMFVQTWCEMCEAYAFWIAKLKKENYHYSLLLPIARLNYYRNLILFQTLLTVIVPSLWTLLTNFNSFLLCVISFAEGFLCKHWATEVPYIVWRGVEKMKGHFGTYSVHLINK